ACAAHAASDATSLAGDARRTASEPPTSSDAAHEPWALGRLRTRLTLRCVAHSSTWHRLSLRCLSKGRARHTQRFSQHGPEELVERDELTGSRTWTVRGKLVRVLAPPAL